MTSENQLTDEDLLNQCIDNFYFTASIQGRVAYLLMSIYAVNPNIWHRYGALYNHNPNDSFYIYVLGS